MTILMRYNPNTTKAYYQDGNKLKKHVSLSVILILLFDI